MTDQHDVAEILVLNDAEHILDVGVKVDVGVGQVDAFAESSKSMLQNPRQRADCRQSSGAFAIEPGAGVRRGPVPTPAVIALPAAQAVFSWATMRGTLTSPPGGRPPG